MSAVATPIAPLAITSSGAWTRLIKGHTATYVWDHLMTIVPASGLISLTHFAVWSILMRYTRAYRVSEFLVSHKRLQDATCLSESGLRGILKMLEMQGFLSVIDKQVNRFGKQYCLRPCIPKCLIPALETSLGRSGKKAVYDTAPKSKPKHTVSVALTPAPALSFHAPVDTTQSAQVQRIVHGHIAFKKADNNSQERLMLDEVSKDEAGEKYLSWEGKSLEKTQAYLPLSNALAVPYQPREGKAKEWLPSFEDLEATISPLACIPITEEAKRLQIDVADWATETQITFFKQCHQKSHSGKSYCQFLLQERKNMDREFPAYLAKLLPEGTASWVTTLLDRMKAFQSPAASDWFPQTAEHLSVALKQYALTKDKMPVQALSPSIALSLPTHWFNRLIKTAQNFKLSQAQVLELGYHIKNSTPRKPCATFSEKWEFNLCVAVNLLKKGLWTCPKGLESQRTCYLKRGEKSC